MKKLKGVLMLSVLAFLFANSALAQDNSSKTNPGNVATALINGQSTGEISIGDLCESKILTNVKGCTVVSFKLTVPVDGNLVSLVSSSNKLTEEQKQLVMKRKSGDKVYFEEIKYQDATGTIKKLPDLIFKLK